VLATHKNGANSALRVLAPWVIVMSNMILAALGMWAILRQYGDSTLRSEPPLVPTQWEIGRAPYILGLLTAVLVSAILTAAGLLLARYSLMLVTTIYTICLLLLAAEFEVSLRSAGIHWTTKTAIYDLVYLVVIIGWWFFSYWCLFKAPRLTIGSSDRGSQLRRAKEGVDD
jgi:hypothetical protein